MQSGYTLEFVLSSANRLLIRFVALAGVLAGHVLVNNWNKFEMGLANTPAQLGTQSRSTVCSLLGYCTVVYVSRLKGLHGAVLDPCRKLDEAALVTSKHRQPIVCCISVHLTHLVSAHGN